MVEECEEKRGGCTYNVSWALVHEEVLKVHHWIDLKEI
jgi:hypothetical protein